MDQLSLSFSEIEQHCAALDRIVGEFDNCCRSMTGTVSTLCGGWTSEYSVRTKENYDVLAANFDKAIEIVQDLRIHIGNYARETKEREEAYSRISVS